MLLFIVVLTSNPYILNFIYAHRKVFYGEYKCSGPGANRKGRVSWSRSLNDRQAKPFLSIAFIDGNKWLPKQ